MVHVVVVVVVHVVVVVVVPPAVVVVVPPAVVVVVHVALDRELFPELIESPIHLLLINMVRPYVDSCDLKFCLQIYEEAVWHWREVRGQPIVTFDVLQASILGIRYKLEESARDRVGHAISTSIRNFWRKINGITMAFKVFK